MNWALESFVPGRHGWRVCIYTLTALLAASAGAATWYVSPIGSDANSGTATNQAFATPQKAFTVMAAGDTVLVRGGTYLCTNEVKATKSGTAANYCKLWAYPGEKPIFDFTNAAAGLRGIYMGKDYWHVRGFEVANSKDNGILVSGGYNIIEGCVVHDSNDDGIYITSNSGVLGHDNQILNCDSFRNYQAAAHGDNGDGFAAKTGCGAGNVFRNCRAWNNSDDGWDFYDNKTNAVTVEGCWAFANGINIWGDTAFTGNGNGFKLGGASTYALHTLKNCVAWGNVHKGFDQNYNGGVLTIYNCTGYSNEVNFSFHYTPTNGSPAHHVLKNNISYARGGIDLAADTVQVSNSWQGFTVNAADFASLDSSLATAPRNADYTLPNNAFLRLASGSDLIDGGANVGLPYNGSAPDLGAYEFTNSPSQSRCWFDTSPAGCHWTNTGFSLRLNGLTGHGPVVILTSSNSLNWLPLVTNPPVTGSASVVDTAALNLSRRFYRAAEQ